MFRDRDRNGLIISRYTSIDAVALREREIDGYERETVNGMHGCSQRARCTLQRTYNVLPAGGRGAEKHTDRFSPRCRGFNPHRCDAGHCVYAEPAQRSPNVDRRITDLRVSYVHLYWSSSFFSSSPFFGTRRTEIPFQRDSRCGHFALAPRTRRRSFRFNRLSLYFLWSLDEIGYVLLLTDDRMNDDARFNYHSFRHLNSIFERKPSHIYTWTFI